MVGPGSGWLPGRPALGLGPGLQASLAPSCTEFSGHMPKTSSHLLDHTPKDQSPRIPHPDGPSLISGPTWIAGGHSVPLVHT